MATAWDALSAVSSSSSAVAGGSCGITDGSSSVGGVPSFVTGGYFFKCDLA